jgi:hypothetical protein
MNHQSFAWEYFYASLSLGTAAWFFGQFVAANIQSHLAPVLQALTGGAL